MDRADGGHGVVEGENTLHEIAQHRSGEESRSRVALATLATVLGLTALLLRLPLWLLPGPGRDEASYHYWAHHPEPAFAPLVQLTVRLFELPFGHSLWALRVPVAMLGIAVLWLHDDRLRRAGSTEASNSTEVTGSTEASDSTRATRSMNAAGHSNAYRSNPQGSPRSLRWTRLFFVALLALTPWLGFSGSILHPDVFLLVSLLALVISARDRRPLAVAVAACAAALSKPTGVLALPVAWWLVGAFAERPTRDASSHALGGAETPPPPARRSRIVLARMVLILGVFPIVSAFGTGLFSAIGEFGHMSPDVPLAYRFGTWGLALVFAGGILLPWFGVRGGIDRARVLGNVRRNGTSWTESPETREAAAALAMGLVLLVVFASAAVFRGQFKPNWVLPAFVLLLPLGPLRPPDRIGLGATLTIAAGLVFSLGCSICQTLVLHDPRIVTNAEATLQRRGFQSTPLDYSVHAGTREADVSANSTWKARFSEYQDGAAFAESIRRSWDGDVSVAAPDTRRIRGLRSGNDSGIRHRGAILHIVSDDYGLAMQLQWYLGPGEVRVTIPGDGVFQQTVRDEVRKQMAQETAVDGDTNRAQDSAAEPDDADVLLLPVHTDADQVWDRIDLLETLGDVRHPTTGARLIPYRARIHDRARNRES